VAVEAGSVLILDRPQVLAMADAANCAVYGLEGVTQKAAGVRVGPRIARVIGRRRPSRRDAADIEIGLATVEGLAPFGTGAGALVVSKFVLAIEGAEGTAAMLARAGKLRQWGLRWHKVGVLTRRAAGQGREDGALGALCSQAASQELAGIAITGPAGALAAYEDAGRLADDLGLFLVLCEGA
jgi:DUF1009 family protein